MLLVAYLLSFISLALNLSLFIRLKPPYNFMLLWIPQLVQHALAPLLAVLGAVSAWLGWQAGAPLPVAAGVASALLSLTYLVRLRFPERAAVLAGDAVAVTPDGVWLAPAGREHPAAGNRQTGKRPPRLTQDVTYFQVPGTERDILCDIWEPAAGVERSGVGVIFLHGSGWYLSDKDFGTRPFFRRLTAQGHVVMDVAYRLCPEVDIIGMVADVKHAVAWLKTNAADYGVDPERIVLAGGSAGGHLALLAAYAPDDERLTPGELLGKDLSVHAVVSLYGPTDLRAVYEQTEQQRVIDLPRPEIGLPGAADKAIDFQDAGRVDTLVGGHPHEVPEMYDLASPVHHVHPGCPPTLLIHGDLDCITPTAAVRDLYRGLEANGVPVTLVVYPLTQHAFDLLLPQVSPPARAAFAEVERFLASVA